MLEKFNKGPEIDFSDISGNNMEYTIKEKAQLDKQKKPVLNKSSEHHDTLALGVTINSDSKKIKKINNLFKNYLIV